MDRQSKFLENKKVKRVGVRQSFKNKYEHNARLFFSDKHYVGNIIEPTYNNSEQSLEEGK